MESLKNQGTLAFLDEVKKRSLQTMQNRAEKELNPNHYPLSSEAKKRLRWLYLLSYEQGGASQNLGITRQWLSVIKKTFEDKRKDPRSLEPQ